MNIVEYLNLSLEATNLLNSCMMIGSIGLDWFDTLWASLLEVGRGWCTSPIKHSSKKYLASRRSILQAAMYSRVSESYV